MKKIIETVTLGWPTYTASQRYLLWLILAVWLAATAAVLFLLLKERGAPGLLTLGLLALGVRLFLRHVFERKDPVGPQKKSLVSKFFSFKKQD